MKEDEVGKRSRQELERERRVGGQQRSRVWLARALLLYLAFTPSLHFESQSLF